MKRGKRGKKQGGERRMEGRMIVRHSQPPSYRANAVIDKKFRFIAVAGTAQGAFSISAAKLGALMVIATSAVNVVQMFETIKLKYVEIWQASSSTTNAPNTVSVQFNGGNLGSTGANQPISDTSIGSNSVAHVRGKPQKGVDAAGFDQATQTNVGVVTLFTINVSAGAVIDVVLRGILSNDARATNNSYTVVGATAGQIYYPPLDNAAGGTLSSAGILAADPVLITIT
jgi:hypothetical protein